MVDISKLLVPGRESCNNGKEWWCIGGYQVDEKITIPIFANITENISSYGVSQYYKSLGYSVLFNVSEITEWAHNRRAYRYMQTKLKIWKNYNKNNAQGHKVPHMFCILTIVVRIESVYKQSKNCYP